MQNQGLVAGQKARVGSGSDWERDLAAWQGKKGQPSRTGSGLDGNLSPYICPRRCPPCAPLPAARPPPREALRDLLLGEGGRSCRRLKNPAMSILRPGNPLGNPNPQAIDRRASRRAKWRAADHRYFHSHPVGNLFHLPRIAPWR